MTSKKNRGAVSLTLMIVISCLTQLLTLMKTTTVAGLFGVSMEMDAFNFANSMISFIFGFVSAAISTIVIPKYATGYQRKAIDTFITLLFGILGGITVALILFRYPIITLLSNKGVNYISCVCHIMTILLVANYLFSITYVTTGYFQCIDKYNIPKILNLIMQGAVVAILYIFRSITIIQYALIIAIGFIINLILDVVIAVKVGWRYKPTFLFFSEDSKRMFALFLPVVLSTGVYRISLFTDSMIASNLEIGQLSILGYATQIVGMINSILVGNLLMYFYPKIVKFVKDKNAQAMFWEYTSFFHLIVCLAIAGFATVGLDGLSLLFEHGNFNIEATKAVFICSMIYVAGQQTNIIRDLIYRYFYAMGDTKTPALNSVLVSVTNIVVSLVLVNFIGLYGIVAGTVISSAVSLLRVTLIFRKKVGFVIPFNKILVSFLKNILILFATICLVLATKKLFFVRSLIAKIFLFGVETVILFFACTFIIKPETLKTIKNI